MAILERIMSCGLLRLSISLGLGRKKNSVKVKNLSLSASSGSRCRNLSYFTRIMSAELSSMLPTISPSSRSFVCCTVICVGIYCFLLDIQGTGWEAIASLFMFWVLCNIYRPLLNFGGISQAFEWGSNNPFCIFLAL